MNSLKSFFGRLFSRFAKFGKDPETDWYLALAVFVAALILVIAIDAYVTLDVTNTSAESGSAPTKTVSLNRGALHDAAGKILEKEQSPASIPSSALQDPSQ